MKKYKLKSTQILRICKKHGLYVDSAWWRKGCPTCEEERQEELNGLINFMRR